MEKHLKSYFSVELRTSVVGSTRSSSISVAYTARTLWPDMNITKTNLFKGTLKNHFTYPKGSRGFKLYPMSRAISPGQT